MPIILYNVDLVKCHVNYTLVFQGREHVPLSLGWGWDEVRIRKE